MTSHHAFLDTQVKDFLKQRLEQGLRVELASAGNSGMPRQGLIYLVAQKVKQIQSEATVLD